jgi:protein-S-isoprenylcysteine O-methyltransferase Ste14
VGFILFAIDHVPVWVRLSGHLSEVAKIPLPLAQHIVLGVTSAIMIAAALMRVWGSAYLGRAVVHDHALHSETLRADGPYRHTRNPLYFGNALMSVAMGLFAPTSGFPIIAIGIPLFGYRLIGREEAGLEAEQASRTVRSCVRCRECGRRCGRGFRPAEPHPIGSTGFRRKFSFCRLPRA